MTAADFLPRPAHLKRWERNAARGATLVIWPVAGTRPGPSAKFPKYAWRLRYDPILGKPSVLIWSTTWQDAYKQAEDILAGRLPTEETVTITPHGNPGKPVGDIFKAFLALLRSDAKATRLRTAKDYEEEWGRSIAATFEKVGVRTITAETITAWMSSKVFRLHKTTGKLASSRTRAKRLALLRQVLAWAVERHDLDRLPFTDEHVVHVLTVGEQGKGKLTGDARVGAYVTLGEVERAVEWLRAAGDDPAGIMAIRVAAGAGLRLQEIVHCRVEDVTLDGPMGWLEVVSGRPCKCKLCEEDGRLFLTKNASTRTALVPPELVEDLRAYLVAREAIPGTYLFPVWMAKPRSAKRPGDMRRAEGITERWQAAAEAAIGRDGTYLHDLRRTAYTVLYERSQAAETLVKLAVGHRVDTLASVYNKSTSDKKLYWRSVFKDWKPATNGEQAAEKGLALMA